MTDCQVSQELTQISVFIVEDHPIVRLGLEQLITAESDMQVCGEADTVREAFDYVNAIVPDVVLVDLALKDGTGMDLIRRIASHWVGIKMIVVSTYDAGAYAPDALRAGAVGYVNKHEANDQIVDAIRCVLRGELFVGIGV